LRQYPKYNNAISSIDFNRDGTKLAVAVSYTWDNGEEGAKTGERPAVFVKNVAEGVKVRISIPLVVL
jgi:cell cycle arrest protein BUB3